MIEFEMDGIDELINKLEDLKQRAEDIDGDNNIPFEELFNNTFMEKYTDYNTIDDMFENSKFELETKEDFENIPEEELDKFINENTVFENWQDMTGTAAKEWTAKKLGF